jgi:hypothetical protein
MRLGISGNDSVISGTGGSTGSLVFKTYGSEKMRIDSSGNVGVGSGTPLYLLGDQDIGQIAVNRVPSTGVITDTSRSAAYINLNASNGGSSLTFHTANANNLAPTERMRITSAGQVQVGYYNTARGGSNTTFMTGKSGTTYLELNGGDVNGEGGILFADGSGGNYGLINYSHVSDIMQFYTASGEKMRIDSSGNVTVNEGNLFLGATSSKTGTAYFWSNANDSRMSIANTGSAFEIRATYLSTAGYKPIDFYTSDSLSMRITSDGDVLIGKNTSNIEVVGFRIDGVSKGRTFASIVNTNATYYVRDTTNTLYRFYVTGAGQIHATSTSISSLSDVTLKENIKPLETGLDEVMKLQPRRFDWKNGDEKNIAGFVAQEVEEVLPDLVSDYEYNDEETKKSLKMGDMIPTLVNAIQELKAEIDELKK